MWLFVNCAYFWWFAFGSRLQFAKLVDPEQSVVGFVKLVYPSVCTLSWWICELPDVCVLLYTCEDA